MSCVVDKQVFKRELVISGKQLTISGYVLREGGDSSEFLKVQFWDWAQLPLSSMILTQKTDLTDAEKWDAGSSEDSQDAIGKKLDKGKEIGAQ